MATFLKTTVEYKNGRRAPVVGKHRSYADHVNDILWRYSNLIIENVTREEFDILRHALGSSNLSLGSPDLGWRNHYNIDPLCDDFLIVESLVDRGLMHKNDYGYFCVTPRGKILAGAPLNPDEKRTIN